MWPTAVAGVGLSSVVDIGRYADNVKALVPLFASKNHKEQNNSHAGPQILLFWPTAREMYTQAVLWHCCPDKLLAAIYSMHLST